MADLQSALSQLLVAQVPAGYQVSAGASPAAIEEFEARLGFRLRDDIRRWLRSLNGGLFGPGGLYGIQPAEEWLDIEKHLGQNPQWVEPQWVPVAGDGFGGTYVVVNEAGFCAFVDPEDRGRLGYAVASDVFHLIEGLLRSDDEDWWPFDPDRMATFDPSLAAVDAASMPWTA